MKIWRQSIIIKGKQTSRLTVTIKEGWSDRNDRRNRRSWTKAGNGWTMKSIVISTLLFYLKSFRQKAGRDGVCVKCLWSGFWATRNTDNSQWQTFIYKNQRVFYCAYSSFLMVFFIFFSALLNWFGSGIHPLRRLRIVWIVCAWNGDASIHMQRCQIFSLCFFLFLSFRAFLFWRNRWTLNSPVSRNYETYLTDQNGLYLFSRIHTFVCCWSLGLPLLRSHSPSNTFIWHTKIDHAY